MNKKDCKCALDIYKKFLIRMERIGEFLKVAEGKVKLLQCILIPPSTQSVSIHVLQCL